MNYFTNIYYMISHIFLFLFIYLFIMPRFSKVTTGFLCFFSFFTLCLTDCIKLNLFPDSNICYVIITILQIFLTQYTAIFISKRRNSQVLFIGLSASNYVIAGSISASILQIYTKNDIVALTGSFAIHLIILVLLSSKIRTICLNFQEKKNLKNWWELCLIPVFFYISFSCIAFFPYTLYDNPSNIPGTIFFIVTMFISYIVALHYLESELKRNAIHWENMFLESYIIGLENQQFQVERAEKNLKILHHDMRHYFNIIDSLLDQEKYSEIRRVIQHINDVTNENKVIKYCNNLIVNTILTNMMDKARSFDIEVHLDVIVPKTIPVDDYELTLVIANLFENAINCVKLFDKPQRYIDVKIHCLNEHLLIQTKNHYEDKIQLDSVTGLPKSKKLGNHGLGMQSVLAFSEKIDGNIGCYLDDGIFHIMMFAKF